VTQELVPCSLEQMDANLSVAMFSPTLLQLEYFCAKVVERNVWVRFKTHLVSLLTATSITYLFDVSALLSLLYPEC
jgi:hypothetical protein